MSLLRPVPYSRTRLAGTGSATRKEKHDVRSALAKVSCSIPSQKLIVRVECWLPDRYRKSRNKEEAIAQLLKHLNEGPLRHCCSDEERVQEADRFLPSPNGKVWDPKQPVVQYLAELHVPPFRIVRPEIWQSSSTWEVLRMKLHRLKPPNLVE
ncbi:hypothetical protein N0V90_001621 [Kalmusia sp. IMI 367209]|nr:hypothetical protein N0V90_001621 [Kalmusia sp. IMI 367209]